MAPYYVMARQQDASFSSLASLGECDSVEEALRRFNEGLAKTHRLGLFRLRAADEAGAADYALLQDRPDAPILARLARVSDPAAEATLLNRTRALAPPPEAQ